MNININNIVGNIRKAVNRVPDILSRRKYRILWLAMFLFGIMSVVDIVMSDSLKFPLWLQIMYVIFFSSLKATVMTLPLAWLMERGRWLKALAWVVIVIYALAASVNCFSLFFYGFGISRKLILIFMQTNFREASQFATGIWANIVSLAESPALYIVAIGIAGLYMLLTRCGRRVYLWITGALSIAGAVIFGWYLVNFDWGRTAHSLAMRTVRYGREVQAWNRKFEELRTHKKPLLYAESAISTHKAATVIFVIGESASSGHMQLYGYPLRTTPELCAAADSLFIYRDAISSASITAGSLERMLSLKYDDDTSEDGLDFPLVVDIFKQAGYKIFWLSNQEIMGNFSNTSGVMVMNADEIEYVGADNSEDALVQRFDEILMPPLYKALADTATNKIIFLHLMGSHVAYNRRYPRDFDRIKGADVQRALNHPWLDEKMAATVAQYDNSILYTDYLLSQIMAQVSARNDKALMIYLSDHGENVYDEGRSMGRGEKYVRVPMIVYPNRRYREEEPEMVERLRKSLSLPLSTANVEHQLMTLTGTQYQLYDSTRDVLSPAFVRRHRYVNEHPWKYE